MNLTMLRVLTGPVLMAGLFTFVPEGAAMPPVAVPETPDGGYLVRVHGTHVIGPHCHFAWSTSYGWHVHRRYCDLPQYNPEWRDPRHWHWRLYERARERRLERRYWRHHHRHLRYRGYKY